MADVVRPSRRTVVRGAAWTVPAVAVATTAPAFAASPNVSLLQIGCDTQSTGLFTSSGCGPFITYARITWQLTTMITIPVGAELRMTASRELHCRHDRVTGTLRTGAHVLQNATTSTGSSATYRVVKAIPSGTYTFEDGFAVPSGDPTVITLSAPVIGGEDASDNSAGRSLRVVPFGSTTCS